MGVRVMGKSRSRPSSSLRRSDSRENVIRVVPEIGHTWGGLAYSIPRPCRELEGTEIDVQPACTSEMQVPLPHPFRRRFAVRETPGSKHVDSSPGLRDWLSAHARSGLVDLIHARGMWRTPPRLSDGGRAPVCHPAASSAWGHPPRRSLQGGSRIKRAFWPLL